MADEISGTYRGMMLAIPTPQWAFVRGIAVPDMADVLLELAGKVRLAAFRRHPSGPKKKYLSAAETKAHVSTARLLVAAAQTAP